MQTFLPYADFVKTAKCLDYRRLGKQRVEAYQIIRILTGQQKTKGFINHPIVKMWRGYEIALMKYFNVISCEWISRGYKHTMGIYDIHNVTDKFMPYWFGNEQFHRAHQSNLIRKFPEHYRPIFGHDVPDNLPYVWSI